MNGAQSLQCDKSLHFKLKVINFYLINKYGCCCVVLIQLQGQLGKTKLRKRNKNHLLTFLIHSKMQQQNAQKLRDKKLNYEFVVYKNFTLHQLNV